ncbi:hypothetical protein [Autumnicola psychrophila]|uniref:Uncharacterized protein n=1 Tax=Autumnicola psychrophila TaxID=3075592 RepID=A0ABU3DMS0_9FLAO|nr:hypothetical protein [Zunongwangia sp. F225]MDT0685014.1 hypothetical protein [Zunongwangia sp. F225]
MVIYLEPIKKAEIESFLAVLENLLHIIVQYGLRVPVILFEDGKL